MTLTAAMMLSLIACATSPSDSAICAATDPLIAPHAEALLADGGPKSRNTGERILTRLTAACP